MKIDVDFDVRTDSGGNDPDSASKTLRQYHQSLWSKPLPNGEMFALKHVPGVYKYLIFEAQSGTMFLSSDSITTSLSFHKKLAPILSQVPREKIHRFQSVGSTIGAKILFPGKKVDGLQTINQARGFSSQIKDRFDLTLECIRLHYLDKENPLSAVLARYKDFFDLFVDFKGYVDFFLMQDLVENGKVKSFLSTFVSFEDSGPYPISAEEYGVYMNNSTHFVKERNARISNRV